MRALKIARTRPVCKAEKPRVLARFGQGGYPAGSVLRAAWAYASPPTNALGSVQQMLSYPVHCQLLCTAAWREQKAQAIPGTPWLRGTRARGVAKPGRLGAPLTPTSLFTPPPASCRFAGCFSFLAGAKIGGFCPQTARCSWVIAMFCAFRGAHVSGHIVFQLGRAFCFHPVWVNVLVAAKPCLFATKMGQNSQKWHFLPGMMLAAVMWAMGLRSAGRCGNI